jgi:hypothetical protein
MSTFNYDEPDDDDDEYENQQQQTPPDNTTDPSSSDLPRLHSFVQVSPPGKLDWNESLDIEQGENWLRLVDRKSAPGSSKTQTETQDTTTGNDDAPYPSILSLEQLGELGSIDKKSIEGCIVCIDVDGPYLAIKDMRSLTTSASQQETRNKDGGGTETEYELRIARKGQSTLVISSLERLARRQLRLLHHGDRLCVLSSSGATDGGTGAVTLVLEYRHEVAIRTPVRADSQQSQQTTQTMDATAPDDAPVEAPPTFESEPMPLTQAAPPADDKIAIPQMSTQPESDDDDENTETQKNDDDDLTVDPDEKNRSNPKGGDAAVGTPTKTTRSEIHSPGDQSLTLYGETETQHPASVDQNKVSKNAVPMGTVNEKETLALSGAGAGAVGVHDGDEDKEESSKTETAVMATPQKDGKKTSESEFFSPNLLASPCSSEGSTQQQTETNDTARKEGTDALLGLSNASGEVKRSDTDEMRSSIVDKTNGTTELESVMVPESKGADKTIEVDVAKAPSVEEAVQEITSTGDVETTKDVPRDPSADGEGLKLTDIDKPHSSVDDETEAAYSKNGDKAIGSEGMITDPSSKGSSEYETAHDGTVRKEGMDALQDLSNASEEVKLTDTDKMRSSIVGDTNGTTVLGSVMAHESKVEDKTIEADVVGTSRVKKAIQETTSTGDVDTPKVVPRDPSVDGEGLTHTEIDKPLSSVVDEAEAADSKDGEKAIGSEVLERPHYDESTGNIALAGDVSASKGTTTDPSSKASSQYETAHDDTVRKEGTDALLGLSNAAGEVKRTYTDEMRSSIVGKTNGTTELESVMAYESKGGDKMIEADVEEAIQEITSTGGVETSKDVPSDPSADGSKLKHTETDKPHSSVDDEAADRKDGKKAIGSEVLEMAQSTANIASAGDTFASKGMMANPSIFDGAKGGSDSCEVANDVDETNNSRPSARTSSPHVPGGVEQSGGNEAASRPDGDALDHVSPPPTIEVAQPDVDWDVSFINDGGPTTTSSTRRRGRSSAGKEVGVAREQSEDNKAAASINGDGLGHVDKHPVAETLQQDAAREVSSTGAGGTTTTRSTRKRGRSSLTEEVARGLGPAEQSVHAKVRATRKGGRGVPSEEVDSKRELEEQNGDNEATADVQEDAFDHASALPVGKMMEPGIDGGSSSTNAEGMATTTKSKRKRGRSSPGGEMDTVPEAVADTKTRSARKKPRPTLTPTPTVTDDAVVAGDVPIRVLTTTIDLKPKEKNVSLRFCLHGRLKTIIGFLSFLILQLFLASQMIKRLGGVLLDDIKDAHTATHVISSDGKESIRRTPKLMIGICRTGSIVNKQWLLDSSKQGRFLPCDDFLILNDSEAEAKYDFSMRDTLERISSNIDQGTKLLGGWCIYVCKGVAGNKAPSEDELRLIVEAAGGTWLSSLNAAGMKDVDVSRLLVVTGDPETKKQLSPKLVVTALSGGAVKRTTSWLFHAVMAQHLDLPTTPKT